MSTTFMIMMTTMNAMAAASLWYEKQFALAICFVCYAVANTAMMWVYK